MSCTGVINPCTENWFSYSTPATPDPDLPLYEGDCDVPDWFTYELPCNAGSGSGIVSEGGV